MFFALFIVAIPMLPPSMADLDFMQATEDVVIAAYPRAQPPEPYGSLIEMTGNPFYRCREAAGRRLRDAALFDRRWLFWGRRSLDQEISARCNTILRDLSWCPTCQGKGIVRRKAKHGDWMIEEFCLDCHETGTRWSWSPWD